MQALIFSAGLGTRLYPLTDELPKALAPFLETTLLGYNIEFLKTQGIKKFVINTHHFSDKIEKYLEQNKFFDTDIKISFEKELLDTAGGLRKAKELFNKDEPILLFNVDVITNIDVSDLLSYHTLNSNDITLAVTLRNSSRKLLFSEEKIMIGWENNNTGETIKCNKKSNFSSLAFSGISIINYNLIDLIGNVQKNH